MDYPWKQEIESGRLPHSNNITDNNNNNNNSDNNGSRSLYTLRNNASERTLLQRPSTDTKETRIGFDEDKIDNGKSEQYQENPQLSTEFKDKQDEGGDTALANAPWRYKVVALATALM